MFYLNSGPYLVYAWGIALFAAIVTNMDYWRRYRTGNKSLNSETVLVNIVANATALSVIWGVGMVALFPTADTKQQLALACIVISMMSIGAFAYANVRQAAVSYVMVFTICSICALLMTRESVFVLLSGLQGVWGLAVIVAVLHHSLVFAERLATRAMMTEQASKIISLEMHLCEHAGAAQFRTDGDGLLVHVDRRFAGYSRRSLAELKGMPFVDLIVDEDRLSAHPDYLNREKLDYFLAADEVFKNGIVATKNNDGIEYWRMSISCSGVNQEAGFGKAGIILNATEEVRNIIELSSLTLKDLNTGMPNRKAFEKRIERLLARDEKQGRAFACLYVCISNIDDLCENVGPQMRDVAIKTIAMRLETALQGHGFFAALGGAEFGVLLPYRQNRKENLSVLKGISAFVGRPITHNRIALRPKVSLGFAVAPMHANTVSGLIEQAQRAEQLARADMSQPWYMLETIFDDQAEAKIA
ncbi:MAG: diguanylate cyclase [Hyphomicrobiales bacterium]